MTRSLTLIALGLLAMAGALWPAHLAALPLLAGVLLGTAAMVGSELKAARGMSPLSPAPAAYCIPRRDAAPITARHFELWEIRAEPHTVGAPEPEPEPEPAGIAAPGWPVRTPRKVGVSGEGEIRQIA